MKTANYKKGKLANRGPSTLAKSFGPINYNRAPNDRPINIEFYNEEWKEIIGMPIMVSNRGCILVKGIKVTPAYRGGEYVISVMYQGILRTLSVDQLVKRAFPL